MSVRPLHRRIASQSSAVSSASRADDACADEATSDGETSDAPAESDRSATLPHRLVLTRGARSVVSARPELSMATKASADPARLSAFWAANGSAPPLGPSVSSSSLL